MNRYCFWILLWLNAVCLACHAQIWQKVSPKDSGFSVQMPGKPTEKNIVRKNEIKWDQLDLELEEPNVSYSVNLRQAGVSFSAGYDELSDQSSVVPPQSMMGGRYILDIASVVVGERDIQIGGKPGFAYTVKQEDGTMERGKLCVSGKRVYFVTVKIDKDRLKSSSATVDKFLNSVRVSYQPPRPAENDKKFSSEAGRFAVSLPVEPQEKKVQKSKKNAEIRVFHAYESQTAYMISYLELEGDEILDNPAKVLKSFEAGVRQSLRGAEILSAKDISLKQGKGREIKAFLSSGIENQTRFFVVGRRIYTLTVGVAPARRNRVARQIKTFFDSFQILEAPSEKKSE